MTAAVPQAATSVNLETSGQRTTRISIFHPKLLDNSTSDLVVTLLRMEELSGTTNVLVLLVGSSRRATKLDVLNSSIYVRVLESRCNVIGYPACLACMEYLKTGA